MPQAFRQQSLLNDIATSRKSFVPVRPTVLTDFGQQFKKERMDKAATHVVSVEKLHDGICIEFADGRCIVFTGILLHSMIPAAIDITDIPCDDE
jgi:hypothetical protein